MCEALLDAASLLEGQEVCLGAVLRVAEHFLNWPHR